MNWQIAANFFGSTLIKVGTFFGVALFLRHLAIGVIRTSAKLRWTQEQRLKAIGNINQIAFPIFTIIGIFLLAANEFQTAGVVLFSGSVAVVIAFKELIMCFHGYIILIVNKPYQLGDRIEIDAFRGDVMHINVFSTTLIEVGTRNVGHQRTGRQISFPNSLLLTQFAFNETFVDNFALLNLAIPLKGGVDWERAKSILIEAAKERTNSYLDKVHRRAQERSRRHGMEFPAVHPQVFVNIIAPAELRLTLRAACPLHLRNEIEQAIITKFIQQFPEAIAAK